MRKIGTLLLAGIMAFSCFVFGGCSANKLADALETKDIAQITEVYNEADGNEKLLSKYDETIGAYIEQMSSDLNNYDFDTSATEKGEAAVFEYSRNNWNDLMLPDSNNSLVIVIDDATQERWNDLQEIYLSKVCYCGGLYEKSKEYYKNAIQYFSNVSENDTKYKEVSGLMEECANAYIDSLDIGVNDSTTEEEMEAQLEQLGEATAFLEQYQISADGVREKIAVWVDSYISIVLKNVDNDMSNGDISSGLQSLQSAEDYLEEKNLISTEIEEKMAEVLAAYADEYAQKAAAAFIDHDAEAAVGNIEVAIRLQPDNAEYSSMRDTYEQYVPYALYDEDNLLNSSRCFGTDSYKFYDSVKGNDNKDYYNIIEVNSSSHDEICEIANFTYNLAGKYDLITGKILIPQIYKNMEVSKYFEAYGDGKLLYTSPTIEQGDLPQDINFNVSGVQKLEFKFYGGETGMFTSSSVVLSNLVAQKNFPE